MVLASYPGHGLYSGFVLIIDTDGRRRAKGL
jgi:hypothetical protein